MDNKCIQFIGYMNTIQGHTKYLFAILSVLVSINFASAQCFDAKGKYVERTIDPGRGQEFSGGFISIDNFHFVQFAVYAGDKNPAEIRPPQGIGQVWLIGHAETYIRQRHRQTGALYIVKPFPTEEKARAAANAYSKRGIECWYNPELTNSLFSLMACTESILE